MKTMQSFLIFFYILDQGYSQCREDDLGGFLGAISPELWADGRPMDKSIYDDWLKLGNPETINISNIIERIFSFLEYYEKTFGFNFTQTKQWIMLSDKEILEKAYVRSQKMYEKFCYDD